MSWWKIILVQFVAFRVGETVASLTAGYLAGGHPVFVIAANEVMMFLNMLFLTFSFNGVRRLLPFLCQRIPFVGRLARRLQGGGENRGTIVDRAQKSRVGRWVITLAENHGPKAGLILAFLPWGVAIGCAFAVANPKQQLEHLLFLVIGSWLRSIVFTLILVIFVG